VLTFRRIAITMILVVLATAIAGTAFEGTLIDDRVFSPALEGNPLGDDPVRDVTVYLPSGYYGSAARFPVVFLLHAYSERHRMYHDFVLRFDELVQAGQLPPVILVMPDANNALGGSWYTNSSKTGNWEDFIAEDLVAYTDSTYRTIARSDSRGIAGQSMGGFGAMRVAIRRPDVFGATYAIDGPMSSSGDVMLQGSGDIGGSYAAALEYPQRDEKLAAAPLGLLSGLPDNVAALRGIGLVVGALDGAIETNGRAFSEALSEMGIEHDFQVHDGGHSDHFEANLEERALPFLAQTLAIQVQAAATELKAFAPVRISTTPGTATAFDVTLRLPRGEADPAAEIWLDLSALGDSTPVPMIHDSDGMYRAHLAVMPPRGGRYDVPVVARVADGDSRILWHMAVTAWPSTDLEILSEDVAEDWEIDVYRAEILDLAQSAVVHDGTQAAHFRVPGGFAGWKLKLAAADPVLTSGYSALRFALRPVVPEPGRSPSLKLVVTPGNDVDLLAETDLDLSLDLWQVVEIPLPQLGLRGPVEHLELQGNLGGEIYLDDLCLVASNRAPATPTAISEVTGVQPQRLALAPNYPNPFNSGTVIPFSLSLTGQVELTVFDMLGQRIVALVDGVRAAGRHGVSWDGRDGLGRPAASGIYLYRLRAEGTEQMRRLLLLR
jgi:S-formylglutathione hydrolase